MKAIDLMLAAGLCLGQGVASHAQTPLWRAEGFAQPESALWDKARGRIYVSNIAGTPFEADGQGWISLLAADGSIEAPQWASGLDAPKGMALAAGALWVADITKLRRIDPESGAILSSIDVPDAVFLNDVAADGDAVFVSDMMTGVIWRASETTLEPFVTGLGMPNGVAVADGKLYVGTWGDGLHEDFSTDVLGSLFTVDLASKALSLLPGGGEIGNLDGVIAVEGGVIISDFLAGKIAKFEDGTLSEIAAPGPSSADIGLGDGVILVPMMGEGAVIALPEAQ